MMRVYPTTLSRNKRSKSSWPMRIAFEAQCSGPFEFDPNCRPTRGDSNQTRARSGQQGRLNENRSISEFLLCFGWRGPLAPPPVGAVRRYYQVGHWRRGGAFAIVVTCTCIVPGLPTLLTNTIVCARPTRHSNGSRSLPDPNPSIPPSPPTMQVSPVFSVPNPTSSHMSRAVLHPWMYPQEVFRRPSSSACGYNYQYICINHHPI